jgi:hypothetical protein
MQNEKAHLNYRSKLSGKDTIMKKPVFPDPSKTVCKGTGNPNEKSTCMEKNPGQ